jgi:hypothetical protein
MNNPFTCRKKVTYGSCVIGEKPVHAKASNEGAGKLSTTFFPRNAGYPYSIRQLHFGIAENEKLATKEGIKWTLVITH